MTGTAFDFGAFLNTIRKAADDLEANAPLPPSAPMTLAEAAVTLKGAQPMLAALDAWIKQRPGAIRAMLDILDGMREQGVPWASELHDVVAAAPGGIAMAESEIPKIIWALSMFQPAPGWGVGGTGYQPGPDSYRR